MANNLKLIRISLNLSQPELAERMSTTKNQLAKLESGARRLAQEWIERASRATEIPPELFIKEGLRFEEILNSHPAAAAYEARTQEMREQIRRTGGIQRSELSTRIPLTPQVSSGGRPDFPIRGIALGGKIGDGDFELNGAPLDYIARPAGLINRPKAYAIILRNTSMEPVYKHGWPIFVDENGRKPVEGEDVLVELWGDDPDDRENGPAFIKTLVARRSGQVVLSQYNPPPEELRFPIERVKQILRVIPYPEAMGLAV